METHDMRLLAIVGAVLLGALLIIVGALGARWLAPPGADAAAPVELRDAAPAPAAGGTDFSAGIDRDTIGELLAVLGAQQRAQILDSPELFERFVRQETVNQSVLAAAYANGAEANEAIRVLMQRAGQRVLAEAYLNQVVRQNLDAGFPSEEQVREAYDRNPDAFRLPRRVHLWQIYLPLPADADEATRKATWALAERLSQELRGGKASFEALAKEHSAHQASRVNDGYMGLIRFDELLPPIAEAADKLAEGGTSVPVASETGLHIIRRGKVIDEEMLAFDDVREQVRERLRREAAMKLRQAAVEKISEEYPVSMPQGDLEAWRAALASAGVGAATSP
ncbi:MAG: peptidylprolyl isomerase [Gammaproteobacteria bacterium]